MGKRIPVLQQAQTTEGVPRPLRRVLRLIKRTIDMHGQALVVPERILEGWTTSLLKQFSAQDIIAMYADNRAHEQLPAGFKTDLDLARLASSKFETYDLLCQLAALAMDILRLMGQCVLPGPDALVRHSAKRWLIKTVMQELIYRAGMLFQTGRRLVVRLGANDRVATVFMTSFAQFAGNP